MDVVLWLNLTPAQHELYELYLKSDIVRKSERDKWGQHSWGHDNFYAFWQRDLWVLPLTKIYLPSSARAYIFPQSIKMCYFWAAPVSVDPICPQPRKATGDNKCGMEALRAIALLKKLCNHPLMNLPQDEFNQWRAQMAAAGVSEDSQCSQSQGLPPAAASSGAM